MTNDLERRAWKHRAKATEGFTSRYNIDRPMWHASTNQVMDAIARARKIKGWRREKKIALSEADNPGWVDLACEWYM